MASLTKTTEAVLDTPVVEEGSSDEESAGSADSADSVDSDDDDFVDPIDKEEENMTEEEFLMKRLSTAEALKVQANECFKAKDNEQARDLYKNGLKQLDRLKMKHLASFDSQLAADKIRTTLNNNLAAVYNRLGAWDVSIKASTRVLEKDPTSSKALFRRAYAHYHRSVSGAFVTEAKQDLIACLKQDATNKSARKLLKQIKEKITKQKADQRKSLSGMFDGKSLYGDVEKAKAKKVRDAKLRRKATKEKERLLWKTECERRLIAEEDEIDFEAYRRVLKQQKDEAQKEEDEKRQKDKDERRKRQRERDAKPVVIGDDDEESFQKGYKKLSDGRTTSYFTRELDPAAQDLIGNITPQKIVGETKSGERTWEASGTTWVDRDYTQKAIEKLQQIRVENFEVEDNVTMEMQDIIEDIDGTSRMVMKNKGISFMFEFKFKIKWTVKFSEGSEVDEWNGWMRVEDFTDASKELETSFGYEGKPTDAKRMQLQIAASQFKEHLFVVLNTTYLKEDV
jgi:hypothetical protein